MTDSKLQSWPSKDFFINCSNIIFLQKENLGNWLWIIYITANLHNIIFNGQLLGYMLVHLTIQSAYLSYFSAADNPLYGSFFVHVLNISIIKEPYCACLSKQFLKLFSFQLCILGCMNIVDNLINCAVNYCILVSSHRRT